VIDLKRLRDEPEYRAGVLRKRVDPALVDAVLAADDRRRHLADEVEALRARQNAASKEIGAAAPADRPALIARAGGLKEELATLEPQLATAEAGVRELALGVPNPDRKSVV